jgi:hypothetical protein
MVLNFVRLYVRYRAKISQSPSARQEVPMADSSQTEICCSICNKPVDLETTKTDDDGKAVHAECYATMVATKHPASPAEQRAS